jgi:hypothetical protein
MRGWVIAVVAFVVVLVTATPASAARVYAGEPVSHELQLVLDVSGDGTALEGLSFLLHVSCEPKYQMVDFGRTTTVAQLPGRPPVGAHLLAGTTIGAGIINATLLTSRIDLGEVVNVVRGVLHGRLTASQAWGTLVVTQTVIDTSTARVLASCTQLMRWRGARAPGTVFGGSLSNGSPVVLRVTPDHRRVTASFISWAARCARASFYIEPHDEWLLPFRLTPVGAFHKRYRYDAGAGAFVIGRFSGHIAATAAAGRFASRVVAPDDRCVLAPQRWSARTG